MPRILLIGSAGQLGHELTLTLAGLGDVLALNRQDLDIAQAEAVRQAIAQAKPDVIVNGAAYTAVDRAESEPELAHRINAAAPQAMAEAAQKLGSLLVHVSTDYVFDGNTTHPYDEADRPHPLGIYGATKLAGEEAIRQICQRHLILRTAWVYGTYGQGNFVKTMLRLAAEREELRVVDDQIGTPTWAFDIAQAITELVEKFALPAPASALQETFHFTNSGVASWYDFAVAIVEEAASLGFPIKVKRVIPISTAEYPTAAQRPAFSVLNHRKLQSVLGAPAPHWRSSLRKMLQQYHHHTLNLQDISLLK